MFDGFFGFKSSFFTSNDSELKKIEKTINKSSYRIDDYPEKIDWRE